MRPSAPRPALVLAGVLLVVGVAGPSCTSDDEVASPSSTTGASASTAGGTEATGPSAGTSGEGSTGTPAPASDAPDGATLVAVIREAVEEERNAEATYRNVLARLGDIQPFTNIAASEAQHVAALEQLASAHGVDVADIDPAGVASPSTRSAACELGVSAEVADGALYDRLLPQVAGYPDAVRVFENLRSASLENHLPAFQRCA